MKLSILTNRKEVRGVKTEAKGYLQEILVLVCLYYLLQSVIYIANIFLYRNGLYKIVDVLRVINVVLLGGLLMSFAYYSMRKFIQSSEEQKLFYAVVTGITLETIINRIFFKISTANIMIQTSWIISTIILAGSLLYIGFIAKDNIMKILSAIFLIIQLGAMLLPKVEIATIDGNLIESNVWHIVKAISLLISFCILKWRINVDNKVYKH